MVKPQASDFYRSVLESLLASKVPFVVGGAFALKHYAGLRRGTKDLDVFLRERDVLTASASIAESGALIEHTFPHWLTKAFSGEHFVDLIFNSANGLCPVDDDWFASAPKIELFDVPVRLCPIEEVLWTKSFVMERERFDGADVCHLIAAQGEHIDWKRLLTRFGENFRVLYAHLLVFGFVYPRERAKVPSWVMEELADRLHRDTGAEDVPICRGTLLSREQYLVDVQKRGFQDARTAPWGSIPLDQLAIWTEAIGTDK